MQFLIKFFEYNFNTSFKISFRINWNVRFKLIHLNTIQNKTFFYIIFK